jgi:formate dehydrogenase subunit gamma
VPKYEPWSAERTAQIIREHQVLEGPLLPILHALQETFGYIDQAAEPIIAEALNISRAEVHGVVTFYHDFRPGPAGRHVLKLCRAESRLGIALGNTTADGRITVEPVYCLGLCSVSPSAMIDGKVVGRLDANKLDGLLAEIDR